MMKFFCIAAYFCVLLSACNFSTSTIQPPTTILGKNGKSIKVQMNKFYMKHHFSHLAYSMAPAENTSDLFSVKPASPMLSTKVGEQSTAKNLTRPHKKAKQDWTNWSFGKLAGLIGGTFVVLVILSLVFLLVYVKTEGTEATPDDVEDDEK